MTTPSNKEWFDYLSEHVIAPFYKTRLNNMSALKLESVLKRKNPYLYKAKNIEVASELVKSILDAFLSSQEETMFGDLLEGFAIHISKSLYGGFKSDLKSVDLEFLRDGTYYMVGIKSGTSWGNADQVSKMRDNFKANRGILKQRGVSAPIVAVNGCIYGKDRVPFKENADPEKAYYKYAGQAFWEFISNDANLYKEIITPIDEEARQKDTAFKAKYAEKVNEMTTAFSNSFVVQNKIDWEKLIDYVSKKDVPKKVVPK
jgi:site-specific DNA-methyltransferase (cytosine-N4-specific)